MSSTGARIGVDIGGTFTDVVLEGSGGSVSAKVLTTHDRPEDGILEGVRQVCAKSGIRPQDIRQMVHGTTLATNALIERRGAKTALVTTEGFRDVIEMRTESRFEQYDLNLVLPDPLLPRQRRYTVPDRMDAGGEEIAPLARADVEAVAEVIAEAEYESVAVGLLHSYLNDAHERLVREVLAERLPDVAVSLSCEVSPQMREYERFNTTVANAYVKPLMKSYLRRLEGRLRRGGRDLPGLPDAFGRRDHLAAERGGVPRAPGGIGARRRGGVRLRNRGALRARPGAELRHGRARPPRSASSATARRARRGCSRWRAATGSRRGRGCRSRSR